MRLEEEAGGTRFALSICSSFRGLGLGGGRTSSSGATDRLRRLGEPETVRRCARPLNGELLGWRAIADAADDAGPVEADDWPSEASLDDPNILLAA